MKKESSPNDRVRDKVISVRVNQHERKLFEEGARQDNRNIADYVRNLVLKDVHAKNARKFGN